MLLGGKIELNNASSENNGSAWSKPKIIYI
jgi:hypothetical protein